MLNRILVRDLAYLRGQTIAAMLVIACGVAAFVSMRSTYESLLFAQRDYYARYQFADVFAQVKRAPISLASQLRAIPGVAVVEVRVVTDVTVSVPGLNEPASARLVSMPKEDSATLNRLFVREGRRVNVAREDEILISEAFAKANQLHVGDHIGAILNGKWKSLRVVGIALSPEFIYEVGSGSLFPDNRRFGVLWMDEKAVRSAFDMEAAFNDVIISAQSHANLRQIIDRVDRLLEPYGGVGAFDREEQVSHRFISDEISQNRVTSGYIPALFFGVAAFLLHIVLTRLVSLQRAQIGLLRAFGFTNRAIVAHYFKLAIAMVAGGIVLGVAGGWYLGNTITALYRNYYRFPILEFQSSTGVIATAIIVSFLTALTGAMWAVTKVAQLPPAEAMRPPSPDISTRSGRAAWGTPDLLGRDANDLAQYFQAKWKVNIVDCRNGVCCRNTVGWRILSRCYRLFTHDRISICATSRCVRVVP
ncbi:MAG: ABC transporter permease [Gammaproteobacteria bacterium]